MDLFLIIHNSWIIVGSIHEDPPHSTNPFRITLSYKFFFTLGAKMEGLAIIDMDTFFYYELYAVASLRGASFTLP